MFDRDIDLEITLMSTVNFLETVSQLHFCEECVNKQYKEHFDVFTNIHGLIEDLKYYIPERDESEEF